MGDKDSATESLVRSLSPSDRKERAIYMCVAPPPRSVDWPPFPRSQKCYLRLSVPAGHTSGVRRLPSRVCKP